MRNETPRAGDRALCILPGSKLFGRELLVMSNPFVSEFFDSRIGIYRLRRGLVCEIAHPDKATAWPYKRWVCLARYLVRIPPDEEAKRIFAGELVGESA